MNVVWVTDIHLNFVDGPGREEFAVKLRGTGADAVLVGGDIGEAPTVAGFLESLADRLALPIYFVLGNHDYYRGSIRAVRTQMEELNRRCDNLFWLPASGVVPLGDQTGLVGHGGWGDGRLGDFLGSTVMLNDYVVIEELAWLDTRTRLERLNRLGDEAGAFLRSAVEDAARRYRHLVVLMHVPPFREACWYEGEISDDEWLPHFSCQAAGQALLEVMGAHPSCEATVLCGHTHGWGTAQPLPNLVVHTGAATYGSPEIQRVFDCA